MIKTIFMGTPEFALSSLEYVHKNTNLLAIFTKEDKLNSRGNKIIYSPVKQYAIENNIECIQEKNIRSKEVIDKLIELEPDLIVVAAYGKIIPKSIIDIPKLGIINVHSSLLPKYRGASPIHNALLNGDTKTGVTIMMIDAGLDTGDMLEKAEVEILEEDNLQTLTNKLSEIAPMVLKTAIDKLILGTETRTKQDDSLATIVKPITKEQTKINWNNNKEDIFNLIRALNPKPCAYTILNGSRVKIYESKKIETMYDSIGKVVEFTKNGPIISCKNGALLLKTIQMEGKKIQSGIDLINGRKICVGDDLND
ncbi:methionyl-tRNA formyltransferase [Oceanivirga salmonicida]|uniref:methionyl-tRNA formyltransferase n=1 Tax=Oceanivirga salmonicida TaxID=1769291 RepID=UPI000AF21E15|nr:methionyl-tRNA formyltransferase [Oceanivirga salmonicida]